MPTVQSFYRNNIPARLVDAQARVFDHFGIALNQCLDNSLSHATWLERTLAKASDEDVVVIADIDAFPLSREAFDRMVGQARKGALVGLSQVANHKDPNRIYAGPMFMALPGNLYEDFGEPRLDRTDTRDVAQVLTDLANERDIPVALIPPRFAIQPKWALADQGVFGVGTFYGEMEFFHLFQSRKQSSVDLFCAVAEGTIAGRHDFQRYLEVMAPRKKRFGLF
ncbi:hypothetical protein AB2B41_09790 [Marimonas sp. MJW-29]|uniref:Glycosyltransferase n=1 Tax=Sulfitobacter sediminis TaxID=3234186 RepID=A0ABV3RLN6_9RHOB